MKINILNNFISPVTGRVLCDEGKVLVGNADGIAVPSTTIPVPGLPDLTFSKTWVGDAGNRPIELPYISAADFADSTFVLRFADPALPEAQALQPLGEGIVKIILGGYLSIAVEGTDYATTTGLTTILGKTQLAAKAAAASAASASTFAIAAGASAAAASADALTAQGYAESAENYYNTILETGLNAFTNSGDVNIQGFRVKNLAQSPVEDFDAVSFTFLWDLMHDEVEILFE